MAKQQKYLVALFVLILVGFFVLMAQDYFQFSKVRKLQGSYTPKVQPRLNVNNWFSGKYQDSLGEYINENIGFRNFFVRLNNQLAFTLFDFARANEVVVGRKNYLYEQNYIDAHLGEDYIGEEQILEKVGQLVKAHDQLKQKGIDLIIVFAPGKGSFFPEYFPKVDAKKIKSTTNYETFTSSIKETSLNFIDFNFWFRDLKGKTVAPLYPKTGIHWSRFGELMAADSLLRFIENLKGIQLPKYNFTDTIFTKNLAYTDEDIEKGMNLMFDIADFEMAYPNYYIEKNEQSKNSKTLVVADSYYWGLFGSGFAVDFLDNGQFWYYMEQIYQHDQPMRSVGEVKLLEELEKHETVILLSTDANLYRFPFGFIDNMGLAIEQAAENEREARIIKQMSIIKASEEWFNDIKGYAKESNISVEKALRDNAEYMIWAEDTQNKE